MVTGTILDGRIANTKRGKLQARGVKENSRKVENASQEKTNVEGGKT